MRRLIRLPAILIAASQLRGSARQTLDRAMRACRRPTPPAPAPSRSSSNAARLYTTLPNPTCKPKPPTACILDAPRTVSRSFDPNDFIAQAPEQIAGCRASCPAEWPSPGSQRPSGRQDAALWNLDISAALNPEGMTSLTQGSARRATLIGNPKLFTVGEESLTHHSPQPTVNNFAPMLFEPVNKYGFGLACAGLTPDWEDESCNPNDGTFKPRASLPVRCLDSKRILKCPALELSAIRASRSQGQRELISYIRL